MTINSQQIQGDPPEHPIEGCESFSIVQENAFCTMGPHRGSSEWQAFLLRDAIVLSGETQSGKSWGADPVTK